MKKSLLALAVTAAAAVTFASAASAAAVYDKDGTSLDVYGRVQSVIYNGKMNQAFDEKTSMTTSARLGLDMRTNLMTGIDAFAKAEWDASASNNDDVEHFTSRDMYVGVDFGKFGAIKFGKFDEAIKDVISATDIFEDYGCAGLAGNDDRHQSMIGYTWSGYGVDVNVNYSFAKKNQHVDGAYLTAGESANLDGTASVAVGYTTPDVLFGPIHVGVGYAYAQFADYEDATALEMRAVRLNDKSMPLPGLYYDEYNQIAAGVSWGSLDVGPYVAAVYQKRKFDLKVNKDFVALYDGNSDLDTDVEGYEIAVGYGFANGLSLRAGYARQTIEDEIDTAVVDLFANWQINSNFNVWVEAGLDAGTDDDHTVITDEKKNVKIYSLNNFANVTGVNNEENKFSAGIRYTF